jgi:site-specific DNA-methyltransferase (adenine-specific)
MAISIVTNEDNMAMMARYPDKFFDLAIVDPPYGISVNMNAGKRKNEKQKHAKKNWDNEAPTNIYFQELFRVSKNQIVWGGNCFILPVSYGWIFWDKQISGDVTFSHGELAWTSFNKSLKKFVYRIQNAIELRIHPTQKPTNLYNWILQNYATPGDKILDTHLGSGSSRIAAYDLGFDFYGCELDKDYFAAQEKRFATHIAQQKLFAPVQAVHTQTTLL